MTPTAASRQVLLALVLSLLFFQARAQNQLGMRLERYAGIYSISVNPAFSAFNPQGWDVSLGSADLFAGNSYAFIREQSLMEVLRRPDDVVYVGDTSLENSPDNPILADYYNIDRSMHAVVQTRISGPAFSFRVADRHTFGLSASLRFNSSVYRIPGALRYENATDLPKFQPVPIRRLQSTTMAWGEIALHYSYRNTDAAGRLISFGATPKLLLGLEGAFGRADATFDYTPLTGDSAAFRSADWEYGATLFNARRIDNDEDFRARVNGSGAGLDLGFAIAMPAADGDADEDYAWRLGVSIIDLGFVRFRKDAQLHRIGIDSLYRMDANDLSGAQDVDDLIGSVSQTFLGDPQASLQGNAFSMATPALLSVQFDGRLARGVYLAGVWTQRLPLFARNLKAPNQIALVPRFEHRWFAASLPLSLTDWRDVNVGAAVRLGVLTLGTEQLGSWFGRPQLTGADIYVGLKINGFHFGGSGKGRSRSGGGNRNWRKIKCYEF